jgi:hypothetical protein
MDSKGTLDSYKNKAMQEGRMSYNSNGEVTITPSSTSNYNTQSFQGVPQMSSSNSKLPKEILESFKTQPSVGMGMMSEGSVLDVVNNMSNNQLFEEKHSVHEQVPMSPQSNVVNSSTVDYSMIKMIVEDCMKKYMSALKKSVLNEQKENNNGTLQAMKIGDKFSFITNTGDLYEAELKFIKNIKTKKSGN